MFNVSYVLVIVMLVYNLKVSDEYSLLNFNTCFRSFLNISTGDIKISVQSKLYKLSF